MWVVLWVAGVAFTDKYWLEEYSRLSGTQLWLQGRKSEWAIHFGLSALWLVTAVFATISLGYWLLRQWRIRGTRDGESAPS